jgi:hypothetical protein
MTAPWTRAALMTAVLIPAGIEAEEYREVAPHRLVPAEVNVGEKVQVTGKYKDLVDEELSLFDAEVPLLLRKPELLKKILDYRSQHDNLTFSGTVVEVDGVVAVEVEALSQAPGDLEIFTREAEAISKDATDGGRGLHALARRVLTAHIRFKDQELLPLARRLYSESLEEMEEQLRAEDISGQVSLIREMHRGLKDPDLTIEMLLRLNAKFPGNPKIESFLQELNSRKYKGKWVRYKEFKEKEGLVLHDGAWMSPREKHFLESFEVFKRLHEPNVVLRKRTDRDYRLLSEKGLVEVGMNPQEVVLALGFPERVERRSYEQKEFDQWSFGGKYCYLYGGVLVLKSEN